MLHLADDDDSTTSKDSKSSINEDQNDGDSDSIIHMVVEENKDTTLTELIDKMDQLGIGVSVAPSPAPFGQQATGKSNKKSKLKPHGVKPGTEPMIEFEDEKPAALPKTDKWKEWRKKGQEIAAWKSTIHKKRLSKAESRSGKYDYLDKTNWDEHVVYYPENENTASDLKNTEVCQLTDMADLNHNLLLSESKQFGKTQLDYSKAEKVFFICWIGLHQRDINHKNKR